jgi:hypothetical protein
MQGNPLSLRSSFLRLEPKVAMVHAPRGSRGRGRGHVLVLDLDMADRENSLGMEEEEAPHHR